MDDWKKAAGGFLDAARVVAAPTSSMPELANYARASFIKPVSDFGSKAGAAVAGIRADEEEKARERAEAAQREAMDPDKYQKVRKADGGFAFFDPSGKEIDINTYASKTGKRRADIVADSENPIDLQYIAEYSQMQEFANALYSGDSETKQAYIEQNKGLEKKKPEELMKMLIDKYPHMYGTGKYDQTLKNRNKKIFQNDPAYIPGMGASGSGRKLN